MPKFATPHGWLPPSKRSKRQMAITNEFHERIGTFEPTGFLGTPPERAIIAEKEIEVEGGILPIVHQTSGSCVGAGGANAYTRAMLCDKVFRQDSEEVKMICPWPTYGKGRKEAGMRTTGEGSFGAAQARACQPNVFGYVAWDHPGMPQPQVSGYWWKWQARTEIAWSHPSNWQISEAKLFETAKNHGIHEVTQIKTPDEWMQALAQGRPVTLACMFGTRGPKVQGDVLIAEWNDTWAHQQSSLAYWDHPTYGLLFWIQNQWQDMHGHCPTMWELYGLAGGYWITEKTANRICRARDAEIYAHSSTGDFATRDLYSPWVQYASE